MPNQLSARVTLQDELRFLGTTGTGHNIQLDSPHGGNVGVGSSPMELILMGLIGCSAMDVISILRKKRAPVKGMEVRTVGDRVDTYPMIYTDIHIEYIVWGDVDPKAVERAVELSRDRYCPVWSMLGHSVNITWNYRVESGDPPSAE